MKELRPTMRRNKLQKKIRLSQIDNDFKIALDKLKGDGIELKIVETNKGDNYFIIRSKSLETKIGVNDLGFWLVEQVTKNSN